MPDSTLRTGQPTARDMLGALPLVSKRNYQQVADCQVNFETLLCLANVSARNGRTPAARGAACASRRLRGRTEPRPMDGAPLFCSRQLVLPDPVRVRRFPSNDPWHRIASHQGARGGWVFGPAAISG